MNTREFTTAAPQRLNQAPAAKTIVLIYAGILTAVAAFLSILSHILGTRIGQAGGLGNMDLRSNLSSLQSMLPIIQTLITVVLALGYKAAMLRVARGQFVSPKTLKLGTERFFLLLRTYLLKAVIFISLAFVSVYAATSIFLLTPFSAPLMEALAPMMGGLNPQAPIDEALALELMPAMIPMLVIFALLYALLAIPLALRYRMSDYVIIDKPGTGAFAALRESRQMMKGNAMNLIKLDFRLWWYYAALALTNLLCYGDMILPLLGISLPFSGEVSYYTFYVLYLVVQFAVTYFLCNRVEVSYCLAYESIRPQEQPSQGVALGNIFHL